MGSFNISSALPQQFKGFEGITENDPQCDPDDATVFPLLDRL